MNHETYYLAFDLGTTTLAGRIVDAAGAVLAEGRLNNPQRVLGSDVIRRLEAALDGQGERLQSLLVEGMETLLSELLVRAGIERTQLTRAAAAANPAISHLLRRLPVESLVYPPHRPLFREGQALDPAELGLDLPCPFYLFPLVSGYVGGDLLAVLYAYPSQSAASLYLDIGTNGEMALHTGAGWLVTSVAAGPAFEAAGISCGMPLEPGAIEGVSLQDDRWKLSVVGGGLPKGVCGSGLAQFIALARQIGLIDARGTIVDAAGVTTNLARYIGEDDRGRFIRLYRDASADIRLTQEDVRSFQLAKGAVHAGVTCLLERAAIPEGQSVQVLVTGAFGLSLPADVLKRVAMLPENMLERVRFVAGGALQGVTRLLLDPQGVSEVEGLARILKPYPLSGTPAFEKAFLRALDF